MTTFEKEKKANEIVKNAEKKLRNKFLEIDEIAYYNFQKVIRAFQENQISLRHFSQTTGYGYDDIGRDTLSKIFSNIFKTESAIVSPLLTSGTQTIKTGLFGLVVSNDSILSITGKPYDTLNEFINSTNCGSLKDYGIFFDKVDLINAKFDKKKIIKKLKEKFFKVVFIGRSRGYELRNAVSIEMIEEISKIIKEISPNTYIFVDNCYGEFTNKKEPSEVGADIIVGSLIKNPGGSLAPSGGYIAGKKDLIKQISYRFTSPGLGTEVGSYENTYRLFYQGIFFAPTVVKNALKGSLLFAEVFKNIGYKTFPSINTKMNDIVRSIEFKNEEELTKFVRVIQKVSPVDSHVVPFSWDMPGYEDKVIMASGSFVQGSSIELSCDAPIKEPFVAYIQGGITYEHVRFAAEECIKELI